MNKIKTVKIKEEDGSISEESYTIAADAVNIDMQNGKDLQETIGDINVDIDGSIATQLKNKINKNSIVDNLDSTDSNKVLSANQGKILNDKLNKKPYYYNSVADMKVDTKLKAGDMAITLGYYEANDGGGAEYQVKNKINSDVEDSGSIHFINNNLIAELIIQNNTVNILSFGAIGDGEHDDYTAINNCFKFISNENKKRYTLNFSNGKIYSVKQENLFKDCNNRMSINMIGKSTLEFSNFDGNCFDNTGKLYFSYNSDLIFKSINDNHIRNFMLCNTAYTVQSLQFTNVMWSGTFSKVFYLKGAGNNSEFQFNYCYLDINSEWDSFIYQNATEGSDDALNFWFNNLRSCSNSNLIHLEKGGHIKLNYCDFSLFKPETNTYLFELGFANEYGTNAYGSSTFVDKGSRYELRKMESKVIKCFWQQAQVVFEDCDFTSSSHLHEIADDVYYFKNGTGQPMIKFSNCKLFGKFKTYALTGNRSRILVDNCVLYNSSADIKNYYSLEKQSGAVSYYNIEFKNCREFGSGKYYNFTTNLLTSQLLENNIINNSTINQVEGIMPVINNDWKCIVKSPSLLRSITIVPYVSGVGWDRTVLIKSLHSQILSVVDNIITVASDQISKFRKNMKLIINNLIYTITAMSFNNKTITVSLDDQTQTINLNAEDIIYLFICEHTLDCTGAKSQIYKYEDPLMIYGDLSLTITTGASTKQFYGNIFVEFIA